MKNFRSEKGSTGGNVPFSQEALSYPYLARLELHSSTCTKLCKKSDMHSRPDVRVDVAKQRC